MTNRRSARPMDSVFKALADPSRRRLLDRLNAHGGQNLRELCAGLDMARQSVSKHLAILEAANLVTTVRRGREKLHFLNAAPINDISDRWINRFDHDRIAALSDLKRALENTPMPAQRPEFVYTTYIRTTPERLWQALTEPAFTERYWEGVAFETDWNPGSTMTLVQKGVRIAHPDQVVLESDPFRRLSYTWHTYTPEWARVHGLSEELAADLAKERRSKVSFDIEPLDDVVKLTVVHDDFDPDGKLVAMASQGWPRVLADLKTLLETGRLDPVGAPNA